jgi:hypothetical protein
MPLLQSLCNDLLKPPYSLLARRLHLILLVSTHVQSVPMLQEENENRTDCFNHLAGGCAGAASRTVVSPLERLKIIQLVYFLSRNLLLSPWILNAPFRQVQPRGSDTQYKGVYRSLVRMWKEEGFKGFMRGNGINCLRIVPYR